MSSLSFYSVLVILAFAIPELGIMTAIAGAALLTILGLLIPAYIDFCRITNNKKYGPIYIWLIVDIAFLIYGVFMFFVGVGQPIGELVRLYIVGNMTSNWVD